MIYISDMEVSNDFRQNLRWNVK